MTQADLIQKLLKSEAIASLDIEKEAIKSLKKYDWQITRSPYYIDSVTGKHRELDIIGEYRYSKEQSKNKLFISSIVLLIECKSLTNSHIIVDGDNIISRDDTCDRVDLIEDYTNRYKKITDILNKSPLSEKEKMNIIKLLEKWSFPSGYSILYNYVPTTYNDISRFSSFRETTIANTKELDNSVLWKSFLSLKSASEGYSHKIWQNIEFDLLSNIDYILIYKELEKNLKDNFFFFHGYSHSSLHKILIIDSSIWNYSNSNILPLKYFRFVQLDTIGHSEQWIDVVCLNHLEEYLSKITTFYKSYYKRKRMKERNRS